MNAQAVKDLLYSPRRPGAPEPTLLPWLARHADPADLPRLAQAAAGLAATVNPGWPPIADAVAEVLADRVHGTPELAALVEALPALAGHLGAGCSLAPGAPWDRPDVLVYRALASRPPVSRQAPSAAEPAAGTGSPDDSAWRRLRALAEAAPGGVPPLANLSLLAALLTGRAERHGALINSEAAYLLPCLDPPGGHGGERAGLALALVEDALAAEAEWYAVAVAARIAPYLDEEQRSRLRDIAGQVLDPWGERLRELSLTAPVPWPSARAELAAAHPVVTALEHAAEGTGPAALAEICGQATDRVIAQHTLQRGRRKPSPDWLPYTGADEFAAPGEPAPSWQSPGSGHGGGGQIPLSAESPPTDTARYVNADIVRRHGPTTPVDRFRPLNPGTDYLLRVGIGPVDAGSLLDRPAPLPYEVLPPTTEGHWLEVAVASDDLKVDPTPADLFLPLQGEAWNCPCTPGTHPHRCHPSDRGPHVLLRLRSADTPGTGGLRLGVYHRDHLLQSFRFVVTTGTGDGTAAPSTVPVLHGAADYTDSLDLADIAARTPRTLSVVTYQADDGTCRIFWKGGPGDGIRMLTGEGQLRQAMGAFRDVLLKAHLEQRGGRAVNAYAPDNSREPRGYLGDLVRLAVLGRTLRGSLRATAGPLLPLLGPGDEPSVIQIARIRNSAYVFPWAGVYDLPLDDPPPGTEDSDWYDPCPVIERWRQDVIEAGYPHACPHRSRHRVNTLCPYGFWGLRHIVEVPPSAHADIPIRLEIPVGDSAGMVVGRTSSRDLDHGAVDAHLGRLTDRLRDFAVDQYTSAARFGEALARSDLQLVYFYCHGLRQSRRDQYIGPVVEIGEYDEISTHQITTWDETLWTPREDHWRVTAPLVVINGCHTVEISPDALVSFVDAFSQVRSAGVIGTEVMLHQNVAAEAAESFFRHFAGPDLPGAGEALRRMRLDLLGKGNVMGLAYTAYCSADLRLCRTRTGERRAPESGR